MRKSQNGMGLPPDTVRHRFRAILFDDADKIAHSFSYPGEIDAPWFQNQSCDPYTPVSQPCELGNYVSYSINISNAEDTAAGISFAAENNIRLVIKNTGHEYVRSHES
jgi:hypothetical protein